MQSIVKKRETFEKKRISADEYSQELFKNTENTENISKELEASREEKLQKRSDSKTSKHND